jgi:hypothetical protein
MRSIGRGGGAQTNIFSVELVDAQVGGEQGGVLRGRARLRIEKVISPR